MHSNITESEIPLPSASIPIIKPSKPFPFTRLQIGGSFKSSSVIVNV